MRYRHRYVVVVLLTVIAAPCFSQIPVSMYEVEFRQYDGTNLICGFVPDVDLVRESPVACSFEGDISGAVGAGSVAWEGSAGPGWAQSVMNVTSWANPSYSGFGYGGCSWVVSSISDILVSGPAGASTVGLTVNIAGDATGDVPRDTTPVGLRVNIWSYRPHGVIRDTDEATYPVGVPEMIDTTLSVGPIEVEAGDTLSVQLEIVTQSGLFAVPGEAGKSTGLDFGDGASMYGVSFKQTGPVFDLPAGYTVNSREGNIENNQWTPAPFFDGFECDGLNAWALVIP